MRYKIVYEKRALKELHKMSGKAVGRIIAKIESLALDPYQSGIRKLTDLHHVYRARVGNYRIIYQINDDKLIILIVAIGDRKDVYDK